MSLVVATVSFIIGVSGIGIGQCDDLHDEMTDIFHHDISTFDVSGNVRSL